MKTMDRRLQRLSHSFEFGQEPEAVRQLRQLTEARRRRVAAQGDQPDAELNRYRREWLRERFRLAFFPKVSGMH
jgi:hypothetical protein